MKRARVAPVTFRGCFRPDETAKGERLVCDLCRDETRDKPASYAASVSGDKLKNHVIREHKATADSILASKAPVAKKTLLSPSDALKPRNTFETMMQASRSYSSEEWDALRPRKASFLRVPGTSAGNSSTSTSTETGNDKPLEVEPSSESSSSTCQQEQTVYDFSPRRWKAPCFAVIDWGDIPFARRPVPDSVPISLLCDAQRIQCFKMQPIEDLLANNFTIERELHRAEDTTVQRVQFRVCVTGDGIPTFFIKLPTQKWSDEGVVVSGVMKAAFESFLVAHSLRGDPSNAAAFFGIACTAVQEKLHEKLYTVNPGESKVARFARASFKDTARNVQLECKREESEPRDALLFSSKSASAVVGRIISTIEESLLVGRDPEARVKLIFSSLLAQPDVKKVLRALIMDGPLALSEKEQQAHAGIMQRLRQAITDVGCSGSTKSRELRQSIMNICAPPPKSGLLRATARVLNLQSTRGLVAGQNRVKEYRAQVDAEGAGASDEESDGDLENEEQRSKKSRRNESPFCAPELNEKSARTPQKQLDLAKQCWEENTRVTANKKNVKTRDGITRAVQWLEDTEFNFYRAHLKRHDLYHKAELLIRGVSKSTTSIKLHAALNRFGEILSVKLHKKYAHVLFKDAEAAQQAVAAAGKNGRQLDLNEDRKETEVTFRPLIGFTVFQRQRPFYVCCVEQATCVCQACYGMRLLFDAMLKFQHWEAACPRVLELIQDIKRHAGKFSPTVETLLELFFCELDPDTGFFKKQCAFGECKACGLDNFFGTLEVKDGESLPGSADEIPFELKYGAYTRVELPSLDKEGTPRKKVVVNTVSAAPSEFLQTLKTSLQLHATHKFIALHQSLRRVHLKANLTEEMVAWEMDFGENYEIVFGIEVQSEHWSHAQVTLFVVIVHDLDQDGDLRSQAHVVVSSDLQHDSEAVQHYFSSIFKAVNEQGTKTVHWIDSDGAGGHFKNRFTFQFGCEHKVSADIRILAWETCAPGHGKGPWDGLIAVIKSWVRRFEIQRKASGARATFSPRGMFEVLRERSKSWCASIKERHTMSEVTFWYVPSKDEECTAGPNVLPPVPRLRARCLVTHIDGIRTHFFFVFIDATTLWMRKLSCHCDTCRRGEFKSCPHDDECGPWQVVKVLKTAASAPVTLRSAKSNLDARRRELARGAALGQLVALESADDEQGFTWWLAVVSGVAFQHVGKAATTKGGVKLVKDGWYLSVKFYERSPPTSSDTFLLDNKNEMMIDAEGVIFTSSSLALQPARAQRSRCAAPSLMRLSNAATVIAEIESALQTLSI